MRRRSGLVLVGRFGRRGAAVVELAIVLPVLLLLVFGIIEFGHVAYVRHVLINAATVGARAAIVPGATEEGVKDVVDQALAAGRLDDYDIKYDYTPETVTLSVPYSQVSLLGIFDEFTLTSRCTMFRGPLD